MEFNKFETGGKFLTMESNVKLDDNEGALSSRFPFDNTKEAKVESTRTLLETLSKNMVNLWQSYLWLNFSKPPNTSHQNHITSSNFIKSAISLRVLEKH